MVTPSASGSAKRVVRIVSKCSSEDEFASLFSRFVDQESIFIVTKTPKPIGAKSQFFITLADGAPVLSGRGEVIEAVKDKSGKFKRPGMRIKFETLGPGCKELLDRMTGQPASLPPLPQHIRPTATPPPPVPAPAPGQSPEQAAQIEARAAAEAASKEEARVAGSATVLPANPFGELTEASLEAFIECTMYEESGAIQLPEEDKAEDGTDLLPAWWPRGDDDDDPVAPPPQARPGTPPPVAAAMAPPPAVPNAGASGAFGQTPAPPSLPYGGQNTPAPFGQHGPPRAPNARQAEPTELVYRPTILPLAKSNSTRNMAIVAGVASVLSLGIGYAVWGGGSDDSDKDKTTKTKAAGTDAGKAGPKPDGDNKKPDGDNKKPNGDSKKPDGDNKKPDGDNKKPDGDNKKPDGDNKKPDGDNKKPVKADTDTKTPDTDTKTPDTDTKTPDTDTKTPDTDTAAANTDECTLKVATRPAGATLTMGGKRIGTTPYSGTANCGSATLVVTRPRYQKVFRRVRLQAGKESALNLRLQRPIHRLLVTSSPRGASVYVGGRRVGKAPVYTNVPGFERMSIVVTRRGYKRWSKRVYINKKRHTVRARLRR